MSDSSAEASVDLLAKAQSGDEDALNQLLARYLPRLRRWAVELGHGFGEIAAELKKPSVDAARMAVTRARARLAQEMRRDR